MLSYGDQDRYQEGVKVTSLVLCFQLDKVCVTGQNVPKLWVTESEENIITKCIMRVNGTDSDLVIHKWLYTEVGCYRGYVREGGK